MQTTKVKQVYTGKLTNFLIQMQQAQLSALRDWNQLLENGWQEVAPGMLRHPDKPDEEVHFG